ncbi:oxidoreductase, partial [Acinetobacter baumannii]|nr:oxidoreductase [Acinetobacter baumannii]
KTEFTLTLKIVKEWKPTLIGTLLGMAGGVANRLI